MNKYLLMAGAAACLSATACSNDGYRYNQDSTEVPNTGYYSGYPESGYGNRSDQLNHPTTMNTERVTPDDEYYGRHADRGETKARYWFDRIDHGHKGYITQIDLHRHSDRIFRQMDTDHNGKVTFDEFEDFKQRDMHDFRSHMHWRHDDDATSRNDNY